MHSYVIGSYICDWIYKTCSKSHIWLFENYRFEALNLLWLSSARVKLHQIYIITRVASYLANVLYVAISVS